MKSCGWNTGSSMKKFLWFIYFYGGEIYVRKLGKFYAFKLQCRSKLKRHTSISYLVRKHFLSPHIHKAVTLSPRPSLVPDKSRNMLFVSKDLPVLDRSCKCVNSMWPLVSSCHLAFIYVVGIYLSQHLSPHSWLRLNNIPLIHYIKKNTIHPSMNFQLFFPFAE